jgi:hypothetical protein
LRHFCWKLLSAEPDLLDAAVTGDESWIFAYDPETNAKACNGKPKTPPTKKKARMSK